MRRLGILALLAHGCTFVRDGEPWAEVAGTLEARLDVPPGRAAGGDFQKLDTDYQVSITALRVVVGPIELRSGAGSTALAFDPAHPPPGYTLCHNGHCHREDGALIDYAEISAMLMGGGGPSTALALTVTGEINLLPGASKPLACAPCTLERGHLGSVRAAVTRVVVEGMLRDGRTPARVQPLPFRGDLTLSGVVSTPLDVAIDREHDPDLTLTLSLAPSGALFDGIDVATLAAGADGVSDLGAAANAAALERLKSNANEIALTATVTR